MMQALFGALSNGYFPIEMEFNQIWEFRFMFAFYAIGFILLSLNFIALYVYALRKRECLALDRFEYFDSQTEVYMWVISAGVGAVSLLFAIWMPQNLLGSAGYVLFALFPLLNGLGFYRGKQRKRMIDEIESS